MADTVITGLTADGSPATGDLVVTVDISDTTMSANGTNKKVTLANVGALFVEDAINDAVTTKAPSENAVFDALALKAPLASPTFTGTPASVTPSQGDNSTKIATTAYVDTKAKSTTGVAASPTATQTDSITHSLGRTPVKIRIYGMATFTSNNSAVPTTISIGCWTIDSGNRCIFQAYNTGAITTTQAAATSSTFSIRIDTAANSFITGIIQNVGGTTFDIAWTETGTTSAQVYMWEAE